MAQAIVTLANNPAAALAMGLAGRAYLEKHFSRPDLAERLVELLKRMEKADVRKNPGS
jgi:glycosyltransferase involved in cell wall biosynthesis